MLRKDTLTALLTGPRLVIVLNTLKLGNANLYSEELILPPTADL